MQQFRVFILGAGSSRLAGLPLGYELWPEIRERASRIGGEVNHLERDLQEYIRFKRECDDEELRAEDVDFEEFLGHLDVEHFLRLRGAKTWSDAGSESQVIVKALIGRILVERTPPRDKLPELYYEFAQQLDPNDYVLTFNYDVVLERALDAVGKRFRLFPRREEGERPNHDVVDSPREEVVLLKLHGSVDWFDRTEYTALEASNRDGGVPEKPWDSVFGPESIADTIPLLEDPRSPADPLRDMYRALNIDSLYATCPRPTPLGPTPWLLLPSTAKVVYADRLKDFWWGMGGEGGWNFGMTIIGYSLPRHDDYARLALFRLIQNYQGSSWWDERSPGGQRKRRVLLVDQSDADRAEDYRKRYAFVKPDKAVYYLGGFNEEAVRLIRDES